MSIVKNQNHHEAAQERLKSDKRQLGGLLLVLGTAAMIFPMANLSSLVGPNGTTASEGIPAAALAACVFVISMGMMGMVMGYLQLVHDYGNKLFTGFLILYTQLAYVPFITDLTAVGRGARSGAAFFPPETAATEADVRFVGAMGMMGILGYGTCFLGSFALVQFALYSFQNGKPENRPGSYYRGRMTLYCFAVFLVGLAQFLLGLHLKSNFGDGPLNFGAVTVAMFRVNFPEISIAVGLVQMVVSLFGLARRFGFMNSPTDHTYQYALLFQWIMVVSMTVVTQVAYSPGDEAAAMAPSVAMLTLGSSVMPAFLDFKMRTVPEKFPANYYYAEEEGTTSANKVVEIESDIEEAEV